MVMVTGSRTSTLGSSSSSSSCCCCCCCAISTLPDSLENLANENPSPPPPPPPLAAEVNTPCKNALLEYDPDPLFLKCIFSLEDFFHLYRRYLRYATPRKYRRATTTPRPIIPPMALPAALRAEGGEVPWTKKRLNKFGSKARSSS